MYSRNTRRDHAPGVGVRTRPFSRFNIQFWAWIGILVVLGFLAFLTFLTTSLMGNPRAAANNCRKAFQYVRGNTLKRNLSTRVDAHASHPASPTSPPNSALHPENET